MEEKEISVERTNKDGSIQKLKITIISSSEEVDGAKIGNSAVS